MADLARWVAGAVIVVWGIGVFFELRARGLPGSDRRAAAGPPPLSRRVRIALLTAPGQGVAFTLLGVMFETADASNVALVFLLCTLLWAVFDVLNVLVRSWWNSRAAPSWWPRLAGTLRSAEGE